MKWLGLFLFCVRLSAASWWASDTGTETNGTSSQPWGVLYAVTNTNPHLAAGDTVFFKAGGTWVCAESNSVYELGRVLEFRKSGTVASKITYQSESLWGFSFDGGLMLVSASNIVLRGFRIFNHSATNRLETNSYRLPPGITEDKQGNQILHNLVENTGHPGIASWAPTRGKTIAGNIVRFAGFDDWINYIGAGRGSGMYLQNATNSSEALIQGNISYYNYTTGMKAYGNTDIWGFNFQDNICVENNEAGIFYHQDNYASTNLTVRSNYVWRGNPALAVGYPLGNGGHSNAIVVGNYAVDYVTPFYLVDGWRNVSWSNNVAVNLTNRYVWQLEVFGETSGATNSHHMGGNFYYSTNTGGVGSGPWLIKEVSSSEATWKGLTTTDGDLVQSYVFPTVTVSKVFRPSSDTNFVHVAVFNWAGSSTVSVDLSAYFLSGDVLAIFDAQNIPTPYDQVLYSGTTLSVDMTKTNRVAMLGTFSQRSDSWSGFDSRFRAFVIYRVSNVNNAAPAQTGPGQSRSRGRR